MKDFKDLPYDIYEFQGVIQTIYEDYPELRNRFGKDLLNLSDFLEKIEEGSK